MKVTRWKIIGIALVVLWGFFAGYVVALSFGVEAFGWSVRDFILHFPEGGMTGSLFLSIFNIARGAFIILTLALMGYILITLKEIE